MNRRNQLFIASALAFTFSGPAEAWYGPLCYSDSVTQLTLTLPSIAGEAPGDLKVDFDDNAGKARLVSIRPSSSVPNAHEVVLVRDKNSGIGTFGIILTSPRSTTGFKYELEFRLHASECAGAIIRATESGSSSPVSSAETVAKLKPRKRGTQAAIAHNKPSPVPSQVPVEAAAAPSEASNPPGNQAAGEVALPDPIQAALSKPEPKSDLPASSLLPPATPDPSASLPQSLAESAPKPDVVAKPEDTIASKPEAVPRSEDTSKSEAASKPELDRVLSRQVESPVAPKKEEPAVSRTRQDPSAGSRRN